MKRLFIHAGPPKTATTSLQILLPEMAIPGTVFIGVFQPRAEKNAEGLNALGNRIIRYIRGENDPKSRSEILEKIERLFEDYDNIIYSEEMILHTGKWRDNVDRAFELFGRLNVSLAYCLRDARKAVPSYYCESYGGLEKPHQEDYRKFLQTEWLSIYDLENVYAQLRKSGFTKINCFRFEDFVSGKLCLNQIFDEKFENSAWLTPLVPPVANKKSLQQNDERSNEGMRYTVILDNYRSLPSVARKLLERLKSIGLGAVTQSIRQRMVERRELVVKPSPLLDELFQKNASFARDL